METPEKAKLSDEESLQRLKERREKANLAVKKKEEAIKEKNRKERERRFDEKGKIVEKSGFLDCDPQFFEWMLSEIVTVIQENPDKVAHWKDGEYFLSLIPAERKERAINNEKTDGS